jgi:hypothetical protein
MCKSDPYRREGFVSNELNGWDEVREHDTETMRRKFAERSEVVSAPEPKVEEGVSPHFGKWRVETTITPVGARPEPDPKYSEATLKAFEQRKVNYGDGKSLTDEEATCLLEMIQAREALQSDITKMIDESPCDLVDIIDILESQLTFHKTAAGEIAPPKQEYVEKLLGEFEKRFNYAYEADPDVIELAKSAICSAWDAAVNQNKIATQLAPSMAKFLDVGGTVEQAENIFHNYLSLRKLETMRETNRRSQEGIPACEVIEPFDVARPTESLTNCMCNVKTDYHGPCPAHPDKIVGKPLTLLGNRAELDGAPMHELAEVEQRNAWTYIHCTCGVVIGPFCTEDYARDEFELHVARPSICDSSSTPNHDIENHINKPEDGAGQPTLDEMVRRFLSWKLPENFNPDGGISFKREFNENTAFPMKREPTGTNLFDYQQAKVMLEYVIGKENINALASGQLQQNRLSGATDGGARELEQAAQAELVEKLVDKHLPPHNAINDEPGREESHYHCEDCARWVRNHCYDAVDEALRLAMERKAGR